MKYQIPFVLMGIYPHFDDSQKSFIKIQKLNMHIWLHIHTHITFLACKYFDEIPSKCISDFFIDFSTKTGSEWGRGKKFTWHWFLRQKIEQKRKQTVYSTRKIGFSLSTLQGKFPCEGILWKNSISWHKANTISLYKRRPLTMQIHNSILNTEALSHTE